MCARCGMHRRTRHTCQPIRARWNIQKYVRRVRYLSQRHSECRAKSWTPYPLVLIPNYSLCDSTETCRFDLVCFLSSYLMCYHYIWCILHSLVLTVVLMSLLSQTIPASDSLFIPTYGLSIIFAILWIRQYPLRCHAPESYDHEPSGSKLI